MDEMKQFLYPVKKKNVLFGESQANQERERRAAGRSKTECDFVKLASLVETGVPKNRVKFSILRIFLETS